MHGMLVYSAFAGSTFACRRVMNEMLVPLEERLASRHVVASTLLRSHKALSSCLYLEILRVAILYKQHEQKQRQVDIGTWEWLSLPRT